MALNKISIPCTNGSPVLEADETLQQVFPSIDLFLQRYLEQDEAAANDDNNDDDMTKHNTLVENENNNDDDENDSDESIGDDEEQEKEEVRYYGGTLFVTSKNLYCIFNDDTGFKWHFSEIVTHAVATEEQEPCLFCQIERRIKNEEYGGYEELFYEARMIPKLKAAPSSETTLPINDEVKQCINKMYEIFCSVASSVPELYNDDDNNNSDMNGSGGFNMDEMFFNADAARKALRVHPLEKKKNGDNSDDDDEGDFDAHELQSKKQKKK